jgi:hypothetical protein
MIDVIHIVSGDVFLHASFGGKTTIYTIASQRVKNVSPTMCVNVAQHVKKLYDKYGSTLRFDSGG